MLELKVRMININLPAGHRLLRECVPLYEYSWFIERVRAYIKEGQDRDSAVTLAVRDSVRDSANTCTGETRDNGQQEYAGVIRGCGLQM